MTYGWRIVRAERHYVVTDDLARQFDSALGLIQRAVETDESVAAYLDGSFGSGKSHFMGMLYALLNGNPEARSKDLLVPVVNGTTHGCVASDSFSCRTT